MPSARHILGSVGAASAVIALAGYLGWRRAEPPQQCAEGMVALRDGATGSLRCCGAGQRLRAGSCEGAAVGCAPGMRVTAGGCVPERRRVALPAGRVQLGTADWEAGREGTVQDVEVAAFMLDSHEITVGDWAECQAAAECVPRPLGREPGRPVAVFRGGDGRRHGRNPRSMRGHSGGRRRTFSWRLHVARLLSKVSRACARADAL